MKPVSYSLLVVCYLFAAEAWAQNQDQDQDLNQEQAEAVSISPDSTNALDEQELEELSADRAQIETSAVERVTKPVASWVEERLQNSSLLQPSALSRERVESQAGELSLREAILLAREEFSGSVLSADRMSDEENTWFSIRILSQTGVLRTIDIDVQRPQLSEPEISE